MLPGRAYVGAGRIILEAPGGGVGAWSGAKDKDAHCECGRKDDGEWAAPGGSSGV
jgi:hypothetical protein